MVVPSDRPRIRSEARTTDPGRTLMREFYGLSIVLGFAVLIFVIVQAVGH